MFATRGFELAAWQGQAVEAWIKGDTQGPYRGTLEIFTGGGKTLIALACAQEAAKSAPGLRLAVVVPTEALARQWKVAIERSTTVRSSDIGLLGAGRTTTFGRTNVIVAVLNTAAKRLPELARSAQPLMLIVDECHRAGAPTFSNVLSTPATFRLGLSATPDREEVDEFGEPLSYDEQLVGRGLGATVFRFDLRDAREDGWLPDYDIHHHGLQLAPDERQRYETLSRRVDDAADRLKELGHDPAHAQQMQGRPDEVGLAARSYVAVTSQRKHLLYGAKERLRVARRLVEQALATGDRRILLFHERVAQAAELYAALVADLGTHRVRLEHSRLSASDRIGAVADFRSGKADVLVSVKSLVEGIDVPEADVGMSVASSSSVRQRIQSLGRVLRRQFGPQAAVKHAEMHLLYVADSVDEFIYSKQDWSDLTGAGANHYWIWSLDPAKDPDRVEGPPASPRPTEEQEWERLGRKAPQTPVPWHGMVVGQEYSVDTLGNVTNGSGAMIANPQNVGGLVESVRGRPGGRFRVTPGRRLVLVWGEMLEGTEPFVAGQLEQVFRAANQLALQSDARADPYIVQPGDPYDGPLDKEGGTYKLRQKRGGVIERPIPRATTSDMAPDQPRSVGVEFAMVAGSGSEDLEANARRVLDAWRELFGRGITFHVTSQGDAWYAVGGERRFLAHVAGGFAWPAPTKEDK